jgi:hypothetical protein
MKVVVINLLEAEERKKAIISELKKTKLEYEFVVPTKSRKKIDPVEGWTSEANSLRLTTIKLVKKAIKDEEEFLWIWEDDCVIDKNLFTQMNKNLPDMLKRGFDFIHLNHSGGLRFSIFNTCKSFRLSLDGVRNCQSYIIHKGVFESYLKLLQKNEMPIDEVTKHIHRMRRYSYVVDYPVVSHTVGKYSYIRKQIVNY